MARLDPRFNTLDASSNTFSEALFDRTNKSINNTISKPLTDLRNKAMSNYIDMENTKKFQVNFNMGNSNNLSLLEQYRKRDGNIENNENGEKMLVGCEENLQKQNTTNMLNSIQQKHQYLQQSTTNELQNKRGDVNTPLYTKNPNMTNNKFGEILEASIGENKNTPATLLSTGNDPIIEPSPSGITRCYVKFDEAEMLRAKAPYIPSNDAVQVNYLNPNQRPVAQLVDSSTSPVVVLKTNNSKIPEMQFYERNKSSIQKTTMFQANENNSKTVETSVNVSRYGTETKLVNKQEGKKFDTLKRLEKSKVIFVNLTPKPTTSNNIEQIQKSHMVNKAFLDNEANNTDMNMAMKESAVSSRIQRTMYDEDPAFNESFIHTNKTIETPVSAKFYSKPQSDRLKAIREENTDDNVYISDTDKLLCKRNLSYYDNVLNKNETEINEDNEEDEQTYNPSIRNNTQNEYQYQQYRYQQMAPQAVENVQHISQNTTEDYDNYKPRKQQKTGGLKRYNLSIIEEDAEAQLKNDQEKSIKTYYDGKKCWTSLSTSKSDYDNQNFKLNDGYESSQDSLKRKDDVDGEKKTEKNVKIQLPDVSLEKSTEQRKSRKCQCFCLNFFVLLIILLVIVILGYFIGFDNFAREKLFDLQYWKNLFSNKI